MVFVKESKELEVLAAKGPTGTGVTWLPDSTMEKTQQEQSTY